MKNYFTVLLVALFCAGGIASAGTQSRQPQSPQQTGGQAKPDSNATKGAARAGKKDPKQKAASSAPANSPAVSSDSKASPSSATSGNSSNSKPATTPKQTPPARAAGTVWVNTDSGIYHKPGTRWYGKTKHGKYMTEGDAIKAGYHAAAKE